MNHGKINKKFEWYGYRINRPRSVVRTKNVECYPSTFKYFLIHLATVEPKRTVHKNSTNLLYKHIDTVLAYSHEKGILCIQYQCIHYLLGI